MFLALLELLCDERCSKTKCPTQHSVIANCNKTLKSKGLLAVHLILTTHTANTYGSIFHAIALPHDQIITS